MGGTGEPKNPNDKEGTGLSSFFEQKIAELQFIVSEKQRNLLRLEAQRNELNSKGKQY